jgi:hypothetical protein
VNQNESRRPSRHVSPSANAGGDCWRKGGHGNQGGPWLVVPP